MILDDNWNNAPIAARVFRIVVGCYLLAMLAGLLVGKGRR